MVIFNIFLFRKVCLLATWTDFSIGMIIAAFCVLFAMLSVKFKLENRIRMKLGRLGLSPFRQSMIVGLLATIIVPLLFIYLFVIVKHNVPSVLGFWVCMSYPFVLMFFRPEIFAEKVKMTFPRYLIYYAFSLAAGAFMTVRGFSMLNFADFPVELAVLVIFLGLIGQTVPLFPDYIEKVSPVKLGIKKGSAHLTINERRKAGIFMAALSIAIFLIIRFIAMTVQSQIFGIPIS